jgi:RHS repeat-associated protein
VIPHKNQLFGGRRRIVKSWHRYYDPETGRYISADPLGLVGGDINQYGYSMLDPLNKLDPMGLKTVCVYIDTKYRDDEVKYESDPVYGDWRFSHFVQLNILCQCYWYKNSTITVTWIYTKYATPVYRCYDVDECGKITNPYTVHEPEYIVDKLENTYQKNGPIKTETRWGGMQSEGGEGYQSGSTCSCAAKSRPPGFWSN